MVGNWGAVKGAGDGQFYEGLHRRVIKHSCLICSVWEGVGGAQAFSFSLVGCESAVELNKHNYNNRFQIKAVYSPPKKKPNKLQNVLSEPTSKQ